MGERKIIQVEDKVPFKLLVPLEYSAHVCHVRGVGSGAVYFRNQSGNRAVYEWCGNADLYGSDKRKSPGISGIKLCLSGPGGNRHQ